jgi:hypothetical protein
MIWRQETLVTALASRAKSKLGFDDNKENKQTEKLHFLETGQARNQRKTESPVMCSASRTKPRSPKKRIFANRVLLHGTGMRNEELETSAKTEERPKSPAGEFEVGMEILTEARAETSARPAAATLRMRKQQQENKRVGTGLLKRTRNELAGNKN